MKRHTAVLRWSIIIIFLLACAAAVAFLELKSQALQFHPRDYPFYIQFAAKLFDPRLPDRFTINPDGFNYLGFVGTEGASSFHQSIHMEPVRYLFALAYALSGKPLSLFVFYAMLYFLPLLYVACVYPLKSPLDRWFFLLFILLYVFYPLSINSIADDLRPRTMMVPALLLCGMAIHWQRNWPEKLIFFGLLLLSREEALVLAAGLIPFDFLRARSRGCKIATPFLFAGLWLAWAALEVLYYHWAHYSVSSDLSFIQLGGNFLVQWKWALLALVALAAAGYAFRSRWKKIWSHPDAPAIGAYAFLILPPLLVQTFREEKHWFKTASFLSGSVSVANDMLFLTKNALLFAVGLLLLLLVWEAVRSEKTRRYILYASSAFLLVSAAITIFTVVKATGEFQELIPSTRVLAGLRAVTDNRSSAILTDYATNQAFYDYADQYVFERLPADRYPGQDRFYPQNSSILKKAVLPKVEYVAVSTQNKELVLGLFREIQVKPRIIAENEKYVVMGLR